MAKTVAGLFGRFSDAESAVRELEAKGFERGNISIIHGSGTIDRGRSDGEAEDNVAAGAGAGALMGGIAGLLAVAIPGLGAALAMGPLAAVFLGAGVGAATGGIVGALTGLGVSEDEARHYEEGIRDGGTLVAVTTEDEDAPDATAILNGHRPADIGTRSGEWIETEWAPPITAL